MKIKHIWLYWGNGSSIVKITPMWKVLPIFLWNFPTAKITTFTVICFHEFLILIGYRPLIDCDLCCPTIVSSGFLQSWARGDSVFFVLPAKQRHIGITLSSLCPVVTYSYVSQATHAFLGMLSQCLSTIIQLCRLPHWGILVSFQWGVLCASFLCHLWSIAAHRDHFVR